MSQENKPTFSKVRIVVYVIVIAIAIYYLVSAIF